MVRKESANPGHVLPSKQEQPQLFIALPVKHTHICMQHINDTFCKQFRPTKQTKLQHKNNNNLNKTQQQLFIALPS